MSACTFPFFFNHPATTEIYTLSLHDALPISFSPRVEVACGLQVEEAGNVDRPFQENIGLRWVRSEEHTSELQSRQYLVCRLLLEKKKKKDCVSNTQKVIHNMYDRTPLAQTHC